MEVTAVLEKVRDARRCGTIVLWKGRRPGRAANAVADVLAALPAPLLDPTSLPWLHVQDPLRTLEPDSIHELPESGALEHLAGVLGRDLAYRVPTMPPEHAAALAGEVMDLLPTAAAVVDQHQRQRWLDPAVGGDLRHRAPRSGRRRRTRRVVPRRGLTPAEAAMLRRRRNRWHATSNRSRRTWFGPR